MAQYGWPNVKHFYTANVAPSSGDDIGDDYFYGSEWIYGTSIYKCVDPARGAAVWVMIS